MDWFEELTGFAEQSPEQVRANLSLFSGRLCSVVNKRCWHVGRLTLPSLAQLRTIKPNTKGKLKVRELVADVQHLHTQAENADALFQVASQFNVLEMVSPNVAQKRVSVFISRTGRKGRLVPLLPVRRLFIGIILLSWMAN